MITLTFENFDDMLEFANRILQSQNTCSVHTEVESTQSEPMDTASETAKTQPTVPAATPPETTAPEPIMEPVENKEAPTLIDVRGTLSRLTKSGKKAQVQELIKSFGVEKLSQIPEDRYLEVMKKAGEL